MKVVCGWCGKHLSGFGKPVSHGICAKCKAEMLDESGVQKSRTVWKDLVMCACLVAAIVAVIVSRCCG